MVAKARYPDTRAVDVSQSVYRIPHSKPRGDGGPHIIDTLTGRSKILILGERYRLLTGAEAMRLQSFPDMNPRYKELMDKTHPRVLHDLAGNAMTGTVVLAFLCSLIQCVPWDPVEDRTSTTSAEVDNIVALLALSANIDRS